MKPTYSVTVGQRFCQLTVTDATLKCVKIYGGRHNVVEVRCDCGNVTEAMPGMLHRGGKKSCGCSLSRFLSKKARDRPWIAKGQGAKTSLFTQYQMNASKRGIHFGLTKAQFLSIIGRACAYCGRPPSNTWTRKGQYGGLHYNGIDRYRNNAGYIPGNVVACCSWCNTAKSEETAVDFIENCKRVVALGAPIPLTELDLIAGPEIEIIDHGDVPQLKRGVLKREAVKVARTSALAWTESG